MNIKKKYIGAKVYHPILNKHILIELGKEDFYEKLGMDIFTKRKQPILKKKLNDKATKKRNNNVRDNSNGVDDNN
jgi:hypothetical protein